MSRSNPPPPSREELGGHVLVAEMHAGIQPALWVTHKRGKPAFLRILEDHAVSARREIEAAIEQAKGVEHPSLHPTQALIEADGAMALHSAYIEGMILTGVIQRASVRRRPIGHPAAVRIALDLLDALAAADAAELEVAGGLRPDFVLIGVDGRARILDVGPARHIAALEPWAYEAKRAAYAAPEQLERGVAGAESDVFTIGVLLWEMLTNRRLFMGSNYPIVAKTVMQGQVRRIDRAATTPIVEPLGALVMRALSLDPDARPESFVAFRSELEKIVPLLKSDADSAREEAAQYLSDTHGPILEQWRARMDEALPGDTPKPEAAVARPAPVAAKPAQRAERQSDKPAPQARKPAQAKHANGDEPASKRAARPGTQRRRRASERPQPAQARPAERAKKLPPARDTVDSDTGGPLPLVRRAEDTPVIRAQDILEAERPRRRWPVLLGMAAIAVAVGSGVAFLRQDGARGPAPEPQAAERPAPEQPAPAPVAVDPAPVDPEPAESEPEPEAQPEPAPSAATARAALSQPKRPQPARPAPAAAPPPVRPAPEPAPEPPPKPKIMRPSDFNPDDI
jgi:serine/threonine-protein kinase